jgi:hypothetical protein
VIALRDSAFIYGSDVVLLLDDAGDFSAILFKAEVRVARSPVRTRDTENPGSGYALSRGGRRKEQSGEHRKDYVLEAVHGGQFIAVGHAV